MWLTPGQPYVIHPGTTLRMGDVDCTPEVVRDTPTPRPGSNIQIRR